MRLFWAAVLVCAIAIPSFAQAQKPKRKPAPAKPAAAISKSTAWRVETVTIEGLQRYTREQALAVVGIHSGQNASGDDFEVARQRLLQTGVFASVAMHYEPAPNKQGYAVTYEVAEINPAVPVRFEDLGVPDEQLREALRRADPFFGPRVPATDVLIANYTKVLEAALGGKTNIVGKLRPDDKQELGLVFRPAAALPIIARVRFTGNDVVPSSALENAMNEIAVGLPYREPDFRKLLDSQIRPLYDARGRVRVTFPKLEATPEKEDVRGLVLTVTVNEGESYSLGAVEVMGTNLPPTELHKLANFKAGDVFNIEDIQARLAKIEARVKRDGYIHVKSVIDRHINDKEKKVDLTIHVNPGPQYKLGQLSVQGLDILSEPEIRKMWGMQPGAPFDSEYPDYFLKRVREDGVFDNLGDTRSVVKPNDQDHTVDVTLIFQGEKPKPKKKPWE